MCLWVGASFPIWLKTYRALTRSSFVKGCHIEQAIKEWLFLFCFVLKCRSCQIWGSFITFCLLLVIWWLFHEYIEKVLSVCFCYFILLLIFDIWIFHCSFIGCDLLVGWLVRWLYVDSETLLHVTSCEFNFQFSVFIVVDLLGEWWVYRESCLHCNALGIFFFFWFVFKH